MGQREKILFAAGLLIVFTAATISYVREGSSAPDIVPDIACPSSLPTQMLQVGSKTMTVEIADSPKEQECGLSLRDTLAEDRGMLFVFQNKGIRTFWMKDMRFPIEMIWLGEDLGVRGFVTPDPQSYPETFSSDAETMYVLEVPVGTLTLSGIDIGSKLEFISR